MFDGHEHGAAPFTADAYSLEYSQYEQKDWRPDPDTCVAWQQADQECCNTHDQERQNQDVFASDPIAIVSKNDAAYRPRQEADKECRVSEQGAGDRVEVREKQLIEYDRRHDTVEKEIVPFDRRANCACK